MNPDTLRILHLTLLVLGIGQILVGVVGVISGVAKPIMGSFYAVTGLGLSFVALRVITKKSLFEVAMCLLFLPWLYLFLSIILK